MTLSKRQQIMEKLQQVLQGILSGQSITVGGSTYTYASDLGQAVAIWRVDPYGERDVYPAINLRDLVDPLEEEGVVGKTDHALTVEAACLLRGDTSDAEAREILRDVLRCLGQDETLGGLAYRMRPGVTGFAIDEESARLAGFTLELIVEYRTERWDI